MKPLTLEEIKNFKRGDWVWLIVKRAYGNYETYDNIVKICDDEIQFEYCVGQNVYPFDGYGKTWFAYKNKEQAEAKDNYRLLRLPEENGLYIICKNLEDSQLEYVCVSKSEAERRLAELKKGVKK